MPSKRVQVTMTPEAKAAIDAGAEFLNCSRSELLVSLCLERMYQVADGVVYNLVCKALGCDGEDTDHTIPGGRVAGVQSQE